MVDRLSRSMSLDMGTRCTMNTPMPVVPGHEPLGIIEAIGDKAAKRWGVDVGDRVAVGVGEDLDAAGLEFGDKQKADQA